ncbi:MAG: hypothetical protein QNJ72_06075 [Pleurocapsa sp. MO_226.B13]|nr:hypothetical protein [Pleurocapsa sp. MO_226.B13]
MTRGQTASYLLSSRGCPQTPETLGVTEAVGQLREAISLRHGSATHHLRKQLMS